MGESKHASEEKLVIPFEMVWRVEEGVVPFLWSLSGGVLFAQQVVVE